MNLSLKKETSNRATLLIKEASLWASEYLNYLIQLKKENKKQPQPKTK